jgi:hypothetical protein
MATKVWRFIGSRRQARATLSDAIRALVKASPEDPVSGIFNQETGSLFTTTGEEAVLVTKTQIRLLSRALGIVLLANKNGTKVPDQMFDLLLAKAGDPFTKGAIEEAKDMARKIQEAGDVDSSDGGLVVGEDS